MSNLVMLLADILVAILLGATIATSIKLSKRIAGLKADESAMRQTIADLVGATMSAERAIGGLRAALDECDRTLAERLEAGRRVAGELTSHVAAGQSVVVQIGAIVAQAQGAGQAAEHPPAKAADRETGHGMERTPRAALLGGVTRREAAAAPAPLEPISSGERINATLAAARALSERALERVRARAA